MAGVTRVNGFTQSDQFIGREILGLTLTGLVAAPADVGGEHVLWPELDAAIQAVELTTTVSVVGVYAATNTAVNIIVEGHDHNDNAAEIIRISALVAAATAGGTAVAFVI